MATLELIALLLPAPLPVLQADPVPLGPLGGEVTSVQADPDDADVLMIASPDQGLLRSTDGGKTFLPQGVGLPAAPVRLLLQHPLDYPGFEDWVYATVDASIFVSIDRGASWSPSNLSADGPILDHEAGPSGRLQFANTATSLYKSVDRGLTWSLNHSGVGLANLKVSLGNPDVSYLGTSTGVLRSNDAGQNWFVPGPFAEPVRRLATHPFNPDRVVVVTTSGEVWSTADGGASFVQEGTGYPGADTRVLAYHPTLTGLLLAGVEGGVWLSTNNGSTWIDGNAGFGGEEPGALSLATAAGGDFVLATASGLYRTPSDAISWNKTGLSVTSIHDVALAGGIRVAASSVGLDSAAPGSTLQPTSWHGDSEYAVEAIAIDPADPARWVFGGAGASDEGARILVTPDAGASTSTVHDDPTAGAVGDLRFAPDDSTLVLAGLGASSGPGILRSTDGGANWNPVAGTETWEIATIDFDPRVAGRVIALLEDSRWAESLDGGASWSLQPAWPASGAAVLFAFSRFDDGGPDVLYRADLGSGLQRSDDGGQSWVPLGLTANARSELRSFAHTPGLLWYSDGSGTLHLSGDGGTTTLAAFAPPGGLDANAIAVDENDGTVVVGTSGASVWELPQATPYRPIGAGTPGTGGAVPRHWGQGLPRLGRAAWALEADRLVGGSVALVVLGFSEAAFPLFGGTVFVGFPAYALELLPTGGAGAITQAVPLPADPSLAGVLLFTQVLGFDPAAVGSIALSPGLETRLLP